MSSASVSNYKERGPLDDITTAQSTPGLQANGGYKGFTGTIGKPELQRIILELTYTGAIQNCIRILTKIDVYCELFIIINTLGNGDYIWSISLSS